jgi:hypothetical protein
MKRAKRVIEQESSQARVVYVMPPIALASVVAREGARYRVRVGAQELLAELDPAVDPALVDEAIESGARVVLDPAAQAICGLLATSRAVRIDRRGDVRAEVRQFSVNAKEGVLLKTASSFVQLDPQRLELFASETVVRAREVFRALSQIIKLN